MAGSDATSKQRQQRRRDRLKEMGYKSVSVYVHKDDADMIAKVKDLDQSSRALSDWQEKHKST